MSQTAEEDYGQSAAAGGGGGGKKVGKHNNTLPIWGNENSMNLNPLILANIQGSSYFKVHLFKLKTYHEVVDEIYYQVKHMEPWERGSRKTAGQTGMCGGVRGVGAGGIVSTAYCLLYKLYTLRLTRKQVNGLLNHTDSPYIRALGFMYLRYTQPPADLYDWYEDYLLDEEEIDVKAGGGQTMTIGAMAYTFLTKLDWFSTLFPRIPVPIQKQIEKKIEQFCRDNQISPHQLSSWRGSAVPPAVPEVAPAGGEDFDERGHGRVKAGGPGRYRGGGGGGPSTYRGDHDDRSYYRAKGHRIASPIANNEERLSRDRDREYRHREHKHKHKKHKHKHSRSRSRSRSHSRRHDYKHENNHYRERGSRDHHRARERSREREREYAYGRHENEYHDDRRHR